MLCPAEDMDYSAYIEKVNSFIALPEISTMISSQSTVSAPFGLFEYLMRESNGAFVNLSSIPEIPKNENGKVEYLSVLLSACIGRRIFSTSNGSVGIINRIAEEFSLRACVFGTRNYSNVISLDSIKNPTFSFEIQFLKNIMNFTEHHEYTFSSELNSPLGARKNVYLTDNRSVTRQTYRAERILNFGKVMASAAARDLDPSPHKSAAFAVLDALNTLVAKGVSKDSVALSIHYSLISGTDDSRELGKNLAAILGAYRTMIELCVSDVTPQICYSEKKREIVVLATSNSTRNAIKSNFSSSGTHLYFYQIKAMQSGLPDYTGYRAFIKYFYTFIEKDRVLSAFSINENIAAVLKNAAQDTNINFDESFDWSALRSSHGILFETQEIIPENDDIFYVGGTFVKE